VLFYTCCDNGVKEIFDRTSVCWLVCDNLLLMNFGSYEIILMCCVVTTVVMVILLRDFGSYVFYLNFGWLVGDHLLLWEFGFYGICIYMYACVVITVAMVLLVL
jgi:hypothetical protein